MLGIVRLSPWFRTIPFISHEAKPLAEIVTVYVPGIKAVTEKNPELSAVVSRMSPEASFLMITCADGIRASVWSVAIPLSVPVSCCALLMEKDRARIGMSNQGIRLNQFDIRQLPDAFMCVGNMFQAS